MLQIGDVLVSLDVVEREFVCNLSAFRGSCCISGNAVAPITAEGHSLLHTLPPQV